jgi:hypothetical protein
MLRMARRLHRRVVDAIAGWLPGRTGSAASWAHYERHAWAAARADGLHARARDRAARLARRGPARVLASWQDRIARLSRTERRSK